MRVRTPAYAHHLLLYAYPLDLRTILVPKMCVSTKQPRSQASFRKNSSQRFWRLRERKSFLSQDRRKAGKPVNAATEKQCQSHMGGNVRVHCSSVD